MLYVLAVIILFLLVILGKALLYRPKKAVVAPAAEVDVDIERATNTLREMLKCRTVSYDDPAMQDAEEFEKFRTLLDERYPAVVSACEKHVIPPAGVVYHWKGADSQNPWVLMAHYDVVPVEESMWQEPPFSAVVKDGEIWGRGTLDTKTTLLGAMEAAETLIRKGYTPRHDIYLAFGGDEEVNGASAQAIVRWFVEQGISPTVLDEGGAIVNDVFPGVTKPVAAIGTGEKGINNISFTLEGNGGHASTPAPRTGIGVMAKAIAAIENKPFKPKMVPPVVELFDTLGRHASFGMRLVFANLWCFRPLLFWIAGRRGGELNAMMRTTVAFTKMEGGKAWNVIPPKVSIGANVRLLNQDTEEAVWELKKRMRNDKVQVDVALGTKPSRYSITTGEGWNAVKETIMQTWPDAIVTPYLMMAATDARYYADISDRVYRFFPAELPQRLRSTIHGHNERIPIETLVKIVAFYQRLILII